MAHHFTCLSLINHESLLSHVLVPCSSSFINHLGVFCQLLYLDVHLSLLIYNKFILESVNRVYLIFCRCFSHVYVIFIFILFTVGFLLFVLFCLPFVVKSVYLYH